MMSLQSSVRSAQLIAAASLYACLSCTSLTEPPSPEPVTVETATPGPDANAPAAVPTPPSAAPSPKAAPAPQEKVTITTLKKGNGLVAKPRDKVKVHYVGTLLDGKQFDSSRERKQPFEFVLGSSQVIKGWTEGIVGMKVGEKRKLVIPPSLAYGAQGRAAIPPNSTLVFEVELLAVTPEEPNH